MANDGFNILDPLGLNKKRSDDFERQVKEADERRKREREKNKKPPTPGLFDTIVQGTKTAIASLTGNGNVSVNQNRPNAGPRSVPKPAPTPGPKPQPGGWNPAGPVEDRERKLPGNRPPSATPPVAAKPPTQIPNNRTTPSTPKKGGKKGGKRSAPKTNAPVTAVTPPIVPADQIKPVTEPTTTPVPVTNTPPGATAPPADTRTPEAMPALNLNTPSGQPPTGTPAGAIAATTPLPAGTTAPAGTPTGTPATTPTTAPAGTTTPTGTPAASPTGTPVAAPTSPTSFKPSSVGLGPTTTLLPSQAFGNLVQGRPSSTPQLAPEFTRPQLPGVQGAMQPGSALARLQGTAPQGEGLLPLPKPTSFADFMRRGGQLPEPTLRTPATLDIPKRDNAELLAQLRQSASPEQQAIDERIGALEEQLAGATNFAQQQAIQGQIAELKRRRPNASNVNNRVQLGQNRERQDAIEARQGEIAARLVSPGITPQEAESLRAEGQRLTAESESLSKVGPTTAGVSLTAVAPPKGKKDEDVRFVNGMLVDAQGNAITDSAKIEQALTTSPKLTRDLTLAGIDEQLKRTGDPMEKATLQQARAQAELDYLANKPKDKERNWKDFFLGLAMGALRGYASGGLGGALGGAAVGGIGSVINPNLDDILIDETFRKPQAQARLAAAAEAQTNALASQKSVLENARLQQQLIEGRQGIRGTELQYRLDTLKKDPLWLRYELGFALDEDDIQTLNSRIGFDSGIRPGESTQPNIIRNSEDGTISLISKDGRRIAAFTVLPDGQRIVFREEGKQPVTIEDFDGSGIPLTLPKNVMNELRMKIAEERRAAKRGQEARREQFEYGLANAQFDAALRNENERATAIPKLQGDIAALELQANQERALVNQIELQWNQRFPGESGKRKELRDLDENVDRNAWQKFQTDYFAAVRKLQETELKLSQVQGQLVQLQGASTGTVTTAPPAGTVAPSGNGTGLVMPPGQKAQGTVPASTVMSYVKPN